MLQHLKNLQKPWLLRKTENLLKCFSVHWLYSLKGAGVSVSKAVILAVVSHIIFPACTTTVSLLITSSTKFSFKNKQHSNS